MTATPGHEPQEPELLAWLAERAARYTGAPVPDDAPLTECGLDSVSLLRLYGDIEDEFGPQAGCLETWERPTIAAIARHLRRPAAHQRRGGPVRAAFVFTGEGSEHPRMTAGLHRECVDYRRHLAAADAALRPHLGCSVTELILRGDRRVRQTAFAQPALFATQYALAMMLADAGVRPVAVLGHGTGEVAAAACGALSLEGAAHLVAVRSRLMQCLPPGGGTLAACADSYEAAEAAVGEPRVFVGALNAARATVLSGERAGLVRVAARLRERGIASTLLDTSHAFHSPLLEPVSAELEGAARRLPPRSSRVPYYSPVYGRTFRQPLDGGYWARQLTTPVRFAAAARALLREQAPSHVVEIGPRTVLTAYVRRIGGRHGPGCLGVCAGPQSDAVDMAGVLSALNAGPLARDPG